MNNSFLPSSFNAKRFTSLASGFLTKTLGSAHKKRIIIGVSGGVDSATSLHVALSCLLPKYIYPLLLPYGKKQLHETVQIKNYLLSLSIPEKNIQTVDIYPAVSLLKEGVKDRLHIGNIAARTRMIYLFDRAKETNALVLGTENKSEHLLGYFTRFGDEASDIELIQSLYKTQVYELARFLDVAEFILNTSPTANLWEGQTDEKELGFSYQTADQIMYLTVDKKLSVDAIVQKGFDKNLVRQVVGHMKQNAFKHHVPYVFNYPL